MIPILTSIFFKWVGWNHQLVLQLWIGSMADDIQKFVHCDIYDYR